jgi:hypothetical protein
MTSARRARLLGSVIAGVVGLAGCGQDEQGPTCSGQQPSLAADVVPYLRCGGENCHGFTTAQMAYDQWVNVSATEDACNPGLLVAPGDPGRSYLVNKLTGIGMCPQTARMPFGVEPLPPKAIQLVVDWICSGAPNN